MKGIAFSLILLLLAAPLVCDEGQVPQELKTKLLGGGGKVSPNVSLLKGAPLHFEPNLGQDHPQALFRDYS